MLSFIVILAVGLGVVRVFGAHLFYFLDNKVKNF